MSTPQELYIRNATDTEAKGPYGAEQLLSLAETGGLTAETLYYDATTEQWATVGSNAELMGQVFPEKKKLKVFVMALSSFLFCFCVGVRG